MVDDINPALSIIRNIPQFPYFMVLKVMQDLGLGFRVLGFRGLGLGLGLRV